MIRVLAAAVLMCALCAVQAQELYRWIDERGRVHISDTPPPPSASTRVEKKRFSGSVVEGGPNLYELDQLTRQKPVTLYTAPSCDEPCAAARAALNRRGVPFKEVPVTDEASAEELVRVSGSAQVPVLVVGRSVQRGFAQEAFDWTLDDAGYPRAGILPERRQKAPAVAPTGEAASGAPAPDTPAPAKRGPYTPRFEK